MRAALLERYKAPLVLADVPSHGRDPERCSCVPAVAAYAEPICT